MISTPSPKHAKSEEEPAARDDIDTKRESKEHRRQRNEAHRLKEIERKKMSRAREQLIRQNKNQSIVSQPTTASTFTGISPSAGVANLEMTEEALPAILRGGLG